MVRIKSNAAIYKWAILIKSMPGLRQAPPQRVLFNPDVSSSRQSRHGHANTSSPQPSSLGITSNYNYNSSNPNSASFTIANYEPKPLVPLTMRSVVTPGNNPLLFQRQKLSANPHLAKEDKASHIQKGVMLPGSRSSKHLYGGQLINFGSGVSRPQYLHAVLNGPKKRHS